MNQYGLIWGIYGVASVIMNHTALMQLDWLEVFVATFFILFTAIFLEAWIEEEGK